MIIESYYIFGAHSRARTFEKYMKELHPGSVCKAFLYDNEEQNLYSIDGIPVIDLKNNVIVNIALPVYLATRGNIHGAVTERLKNLGFQDVIPVTPQIDRDLRNQFMPQEFVRQGRAYRRIEELCINIEYTTQGQEETVADQMAIYVAKTPYDATVSNDLPLHSYEQLIQVGKALSSETLADAVFFDDKGDNISYLNRHFSELTGMYWLWKNSNDEVIGLEHYRRRFVLADGWQQLFFEGKVDVILPVPLYVAPSLEENYLFRHDRRPWEAMLRIMKAGDMDIYEKALRFYRDNGCYSPCNMLIARREVLNDLCGWMFPILLHVVEEIGPLEDLYQNRYGGFLSERMISFFFYYYEKTYKIAYADKSFLG